MLRGRLSSESESDSRPTAMRCFISDMVLRLIGRVRQEGAKSRLGALSTRTIHADSYEIQSIYGNDAGIIALVPVNVEENRTLHIDRLDPHAPRATAPELVGRSAPSKSLPGSLEATGCERMGHKGTHKARGNSQCAVRAPCSACRDGSRGGGLATGAEGDSRWPRDGPQSP